ncbi:MFS transporter [Leifsonia kafniensis]|uniref:MFS transporter n=1 Tax=Leifsonia kafniensis TaxID=475957 RepID=A0ABP7KZC9_9MICO
MSQPTPSPGNAVPSPLSSEGLPRDTSTATSPSTTPSAAPSSVASSAPALSRRELLNWRNAVFVVFLLSGLCVASWVSRVPAVRDGLGLNTAEVGVLIFGLSAGSILGLICAAWMLARFGARRAMITSIAVTAVGLVAIGIGASMVFSFPVAFAGLALVGFGMGSVDVMMNVEAAAVEREIGKTLMPLMHACFSFGTVIGALIGAGASALGINVAGHLFGMAALVMVGVIVAVRFIPMREELGDIHAATDASTATAATAASHAPVAPTPSWRERLRESLSVWADMRLILIGVVMLGMSFAEGSANDWIALAAVDGHDMSKTNGALVFGVFAVAMTAGRVVGGPIIDRFGRVLVLRVCAVMGITGLLLFILAPTDALLYVGTVLWGIGASLGFPVGISAAADDPKHAAARVSAVAIIGYTAFLVGPPVIGLLGEAVGILNALYLILVLMLLAGLAAPAVRERVGARAKR